MKKGKRSSRECKSCQLVFVALFFARAAQKKKSSEERVRAAASSSSAFAAKVWITSCDASIAKCAQDQKQQRRSDAG